MRKRELLSYMLIGFITAAVLVTATLYKFDVELKGKEEGLFLNQSAKLGKSNNEYAEDLIKDSVVGYNEDEYMEEWYYYLNLCEESEDCIIKTTDLMKKILKEG